MSERKPSVQAMEAAREITALCLDGVRHSRNVSEEVAQRIDQAAEERYRAVLENILSDAQIDTDDEDVALHALACIRHTVRAALQAARGEQGE